MSTKTLSVVITGNASKAQSAFKSVTDDADKAEGRLSKMGEKISPGLAAAAGAVVAGVGLMMKSAFDAADESARIGRETERVIRTTGATAWTSADQVAEYAGELSELTGADDELIQSGANLLLTFTRIQNKVGQGNDVFNRATAAALDMSTVLGTDMSGSAVQVGKALNDPIKGITALSRAGVSFTAEQKDMIRSLVETGDVLGAQKIILDELEKEFGGAAEAAATPLDRLKVTLGNLQEQMGAYLIPVVAAVSDAVAGLTAGFAALPGPVQAVAGGVAALGVAGTGGLVVVAKLADVVGDVLGPALQLGRGLLDDAALGVANMATKFGVGQDSALKLAQGVSGLGTALPIVGAAALAGVAIWTMWSAEQEAAKKRADEFNKTLNEQTGAVTENTLEKVRATLEDNNRIDNLNKASVSVEQFTDALSDNSTAMVSQGDVTQAMVKKLEGVPQLQENIIGRLRDEGGARNELIATLLEQDAADVGLIEQIYEQANAYDTNQRALEERTVQQGIATGTTEEQAAADMKAAAAARENAESIKEASDALRASVDPWFAAYNANNKLTAAQGEYNAAVQWFGAKSPEAQAAYIALADAGFGYETQLLGLSEAQAAGETSAGDLASRLQGLTAYGIDPTSAAARIAGYDMLGLAGAADEANRRNVDIPVSTPGSERALDQLSAVHRKMIDIANQRGTTGQGFSSQDFKGFAAGGRPSDGWSVVGEAGPELMYKSGSSLEVFSNSDSSRMLSGSGGPMSVTIVMPPGSNGEDVVDAIRRYERRNGTAWRN